MPQAPEREGSRKASDGSSPRLVLNLLCSIALIDGADLQLLPSSYRAMEANLGLDPTHLALLTALQGVSMAISGPAWGNLADSGASPKLLLVAGVAAWGVLTLALGFVSSFGAMAALRVLNGCALGMLTPVSQPLIADRAGKDERGNIFGRVQCFNSIGSLLVTVFVPAVSTVYYWGAVPGWRIALVVAGLLSLVLALVLQRVLEDEKKEWRPENIGAWSEIRKFASYCTVPTFATIVTQGCFGSIPWQAMSFNTLYFQYVGMTNFDAGVVSAMFLLGAAAGYVVGGTIGDRLARWSPFHGRPITAQVSVLLGIPFAYLVFKGIPRDPSRVVTFGVVNLIFGLVASWCLTGVNRPIFLEVVPRRNWASLIAWDQSLENSCAYLIGPISVGFVAQTFYGYKLDTAQVWQTPANVREQDVDALGNSLLVTTMVPWSLCFLLYSFLHITYRRDVLRLREDEEALAPTSYGAAA